MLLLSSQFSSPAPTSLETALAALQDVSQLLSEDLDRSNEACSQFWQKSAEASWQSYSELFACKEPQDFFMVSSAHLKFCLEQSTLLQNTLNSIVQDAGEKYQQLIKQTLNLPQASLMIATPQNTSIKVTASPVEVIIDRQADTNASPNFSKLTTPTAKPAAKRKTSASVKEKLQANVAANTTKTAVKKPSFPTVPGREPTEASSPALPKGKRTLKSAK